MRFPEIETHDLEGQRLLLPHGLPGVPNLLLVPFERRQQPIVDGWRREILALGREFPSLAVWEVPLISSEYLMSRFFIDAGMRAGIPDPEIRRHTLTAYTDLGSLAKTLALRTLDDVHVFLLGAEGEIVWREAGRPDEGKMSRLVEVLETFGAEARGMLPS